MTAKQTILRKELKNWQEIYDSKKNVVAVLVKMVLNHKGKRVAHELKNTIVDSLIIERDAQYRMEEIKARLGVR